MGVLVKLRNVRMAFADLWGAEGDQEGQASLWCELHRSEGPPSGG